jgi:L-threonylcarbamoyladenylate synthase
MERLTASPGGLARAAEILRSGGVIAFPTDTVYGLAEDAAARRRIYAIKQRPADRRLILMADRAQLLEAWVEFDDRALRLAGRFWPGGLTLVLRARSGGGTIGVRVPDHPVALELLRAVGRALATTSANLSGSPPALEAEAAALPGLDAVLDGGPAAGGQPSTLVDLTAPDPLILRRGPLRLRDLVAELRRHP